VRSRPCSQAFGWPFSWSTRKDRFWPSRCTRSASFGCGGAAGRAPAIYLGLIFTLELLLELTIFGAIGQIRRDEGWGTSASALATLLADVLGLTACIFLVRGEQKAGAAS
jgi:hypothetical protein